MPLLSLSDFLVVLALSIVVRFSVCKVSNKSQNLSSLVWSKPANSNGLSYKSNTLCPELTTSLVYSPYLDINLQYDICSLSFHGNFPLRFNDEPNEDDSEKN